MNTSGFIGIIVFFMLWLFGRMASSWLIRLSYASAGETMRSVEKHKDMMQRKLIPGRKEIAWLAETSPRPNTTRFFYILFYVIVSLPVIGAVLSLVCVFVPSVEGFLTKFANLLFLFDFILVFGNLLLYDPIVYFMGKKDRRKGRNK